MSQTRGICKRTMVGNHVLQDNLCTSPAPQLENVAMPGLLVLSSLRFGGASLLFLTGVLLTTRAGTAPLLRYRHRLAACHFAVQPAPGSPKAYPDARPRGGSDVNVARELLASPAQRLPTYVQMRMLHSLSLSLIISLSMFSFQDRGHMVMRAYRNAAGQAGGEENCTDREPALTSMAQCWLELAAS